MKQKRSFFTSFLIGFVILVGLDQWTKGLAVKHLMHQPPFVIWDGVFELLYSENRGAAFGMMQGKQFFFFLIALVVLAAGEDAGHGALHAHGRLPDDGFRRRGGKYDRPHRTGLRGGLSLL